MACILRGARNTAILAVNQISDAIKGKNANFIIQSFVETHFVMGSVRIINVVMCILDNGMVNLNLELTIRALKVRQ